MEGRPLLELLASTPGRMWFLRVRRTIAPRPSCVAPPAASAASNGTLTWPYNRSRSPGNESNALVPTQIPVTGTMPDGSLGEGTALRWGQAVCVAGPALLRSAFTLPPLVA
jgi:hypothetical protein